MLKGYTFIKKLGAGGFGEVILAKENISGREVAIKYLHKKDIPNTEDIIREINIISKFYHPGIVNYHHASQEDEIFYFVMEYCRKGSLQGRIKEGLIPVAEATSLFLDMAKTLQFIHQKDIVHHDIKPANLLISDTNTIKIADFGVANTHGGTPIYMPPVYNDNSELSNTKKLDIYALGITFIEMVTGKHPLAYLPVEEMISRLEKRNLGIDHLPHWLQEIAYKTVSLDSSFRFNSMQELVNAIETKNIPLIIDLSSIKAANTAKKLESLIKRKKYYTLSREIEKIEPSALSQSSILIQLGWFYYQMHKMEEAMDVYETLRKTLPSMNVNKQLGAIYTFRSDYPKAVTHLSEYLLQFPNDCEAYNLLLECYYKSQRFEEGHNLSQELIDVFPTEECFKINRHLFQLLLQKSIFFGEDISPIHMGIVEYNEEVCNPRLSLFAPGKTSITDKCIFTPYGVSKQKKVNSKIQIIVNDDEYNNDAKPIISIGRKGYGNKIEFSGTGISRKHSLIMAYENENWIFDFNSTGTYVDGKQVIGRMRLLHRHEIRLGSNLLTINIDKNKLF